VAHCEYCGEEIGYLPFRCKYCGSIYCKKHRLPENHECTFDKKHIPTVPTPESTRSPQSAKDFISTDEPRKRKKLFRRRSRQPRRAQDIFERSMGGRSKTSVSTILIFTIFIMSIVALIIPEYLCLSYSSYFDFYLWTFFTSLFVNYSDSYFGIFFLLILILLFYNIIKILELRFGGRFILGLYLFSAFMSAVFFTVLFLLLFFYYDPFPLIFVFGGMAYGGLMGVISFMIFSSLNEEMTFLLFFIPIRMKGRIILILLILFRLIPALLYWAISQDLIALLIYLPDLGGILGSFLVFKFKMKYRDTIF
jgi:hypothetical protein